MEEIEIKIKKLEEKNRELYKLVRRTEKEALGPWYSHLWRFIPIFGFLFWPFFKLKRFNTEPHYSDRIKIKVEIAKNEIEIIKLKQRISKSKR